MRHASVLGILVLVALTIGPSVSVGAQEATTPVASPATSPVLAEYVFEISLDDAGVSAPAGIAVDADGTLYVIDSLKDQIRIFDREGTPLATWGESGSAPGQFRFTNGSDFWGDVALGPDGNLYVLDSFNARVQVLAPNGTFLRAWGEPGTAAGQFVAPDGIAVDRTGHVYVTDDRVQVFDREGHFLAAWAPSEAEGGPLQDPADVAVDAAGMVWVTDHARDRVVRFNAEGTVIDAIGETGVQPGQLMGPWGAVADAAGNLYVAEYHGNRIQVFTPDGTSLGIVSSAGLQPGQVFSPIYLTVSPDGLLYVADEGNRRIQVFRLLPPLAPDTATPMAAI
jgi:tripartite motif-containing protein 71